MKDPSATGERERLASLPAGPGDAEPGSNAKGEEPGLERLCSDEAALEQALAEARREAAEVVTAARSEAEQIVAAARVALEAELAAFRAETERLLDAERLRSAGEADTAREALARRASNRRAAAVAKLVERVLAGRGSA